MLPPLCFMEVTVPYRWKKFGLGILGVMQLATMYSTQAHAFQQSKNINIYDDHGGQLIDYAMSISRVEQTNARVNIRGSCDSACTLYLGIPRNQLCVAHSGSFRFHLPFGSSKSGNQLAANYMIGSYPAWVRRWIGAQGGLSHNLITMNYSYANKYLKTCDI